MHTKATASINHGDSFHESPLPSPLSQAGADAGRKDPPSPAPECGRGLWLVGPSCRRSPERHGTRIEWLGPLLASPSDLIGELMMKTAQEGNLSLPLDNPTLNIVPTRHAPQRRKWVRWQGERPRRQRPKQSRFSRRAQRGNDSATPATWTTQRRGPASRTGPTTHDGACATMKAGRHGTTWRMTKPSRTGPRQPPTSTSWACHW